MYKGKTSNGVALSSTFGFNQSSSGRTWILVASRSGAKLFQSTGPNKTFESPKEFVCPEGKLKGSDTYRGQPGRSFNSSSKSRGGHGTSTPRHALGSEVTHHELAARKFAKTLAEMLEKGRDAKQFNKLILVSEPGFLGILKDALPGSVKERLSATMEKEIVELPNHDLGQQLLGMLKI